MKKILYAIGLLAVAAMTFTACKKENKEEPKIVKRLTAFIAYWDGGEDRFDITYNSDGKVAAVTRPDRSWTFTWAGNVATAKYVKEGEEKGNWTFTFGSNGYLSSWANEWGDTWGFIYDAENHLSKIERTDKGATKANCKWENGNLSKWSRFKDDGSEEWKIQSFLNEDNVGGIFADACDKAGVDRWVFEVGFCGKPSQKLLDQAAWEGSDAIAVHTYEKDADGFVTKVSKVYDGGDPEVVGYEWEVVK